MVGIPYNGKNSVAVLKKLEANRLHQPEIKTIPNANDAIPLGDDNATASILLPMSTAPLARYDVLPFDGIAAYFPSYFPLRRATELFERLANELHWKQERAHLFGRTIPLPRLTSWYGSIPYTYSGVVHAPHPMTPVLEQLRLDIEPIANGMNCVLANFYRDGKDSMSWHADDEPVWGSSPTICSVSFGATRRFDLKHRSTGYKVAIELNNGDALVMAGSSQESWLHAIPKTKRPVDRRINLTFRRHF